MYISGQPDVHIEFQARLGYTECKTMSQKERKRETKAWILRLRKTVVPFTSENKRRHLGIINLAQS